MTVVVIGASANIGRIAKKLGEPLVFVQRPGADARQLARDDVDELYSFDFTDRALLDSFGHDVLATRAPKAVVSVTETGLVPAAHLSELLGTPGTPVRVAEATRDKALMRSRIAAAGMQHLNTPYRRPATRDAVAELLANGPVIVKPVDGFASERIELVQSVDELDALGDPTNLIAESYVGGVEYEVDAFSEGGRHTVIGLAVEVKEGPFVEVTHIMPPPGLPADTRARIGDAVAQVLDAIGLTDGPSHTEVKVVGDDVVALETHNRPGGDGLADLIALTRGLDWRFACLGWPLGIREAPRGGEYPAGAMVFFTAPAGVVTSVAAPSLARSDVEILEWEIEVAVGDRVRELRSSNDRIGWALLAGDSPEACRDAAIELRASEVVKTSGSAR